jgi:hypothetical protein
MKGTSKIAALVGTIGLVSLLFGCGSAPIEQGQQVTLGPNEGVAAVVIDTLDVLDQISFDAVGHDAKPLAITNAPKGISLYVFVVPAGTYCSSGFHFGNWAFHSLDPKHGACFDVLAGKIAYSGDIGPRAFSKNDIRTYQNYDWPRFEEMLKKQYPDLAAKYPLVTP